VTVFRLKILISAGPTRESLDPVRYLTNHSTGEMGYALARAFRAQGHSVTLVSGPTALRAPRGVRFVSITSALELQRVLRRLFVSHHLLVMSAAVCDFMPAQFCAQKIRRSGGLTLRLKKTPDIVASLAARKGKRKVIGFCLETSKWLEGARRKLAAKKLDGIVATYLGPRHRPFGQGKVTMALMTPDGRLQRLNSRPKARIAQAIAKWAQRIWFLDRTK